MEVSGQLNSATLSCAKKDPQVPMNGRLGGPQIRPGSSGKEKFSSSCSKAKWECLKHVTTTAL
jgi:hypothetical protein